VNPVGFLLAIAKHLYAPTSPSHLPDYDGRKAKPKVVACSSPTLSKWLESPRRAFVCAGMRFATLRQRILT